jgi:hypothetical protein
MWLEMISRVFKDREDNEDTAWAQRVDNINAEDESEDNNMDGESGDGAEGETANDEKDHAPSFLDPKYL